MRECNRSGDLDLGRDLSQSLFLLKKSSSSSTASIQVDFSPLGKPECNQSSPSKTLPTFNTDRNYYTPSFILEVDQQKYEENLQIYLNIHNRKSLQISEQKAELFVPKPSKNNSYCCVCKVPFDDYLTHLSFPKHQYLIKKSDYEQKIKDLCQTFKQPEIQNKTPKKRGRPTKQKTRHIKKPKLAKNASAKQTCEQDSSKDQIIPIQKME